MNRKKKISFGLTFLWSAFTLTHECYLATPFERGEATLRRLQEAQHGEGPFAGIWVTVLAKHHFRKAELVVSVSENIKNSLKRFEFAWKTPASANKKGCKCRKTAFTPSTLLTFRICRPRQTTSTYHTNSPLCRRRSI